MDRSIAACSCSRSGPRRGEPWRASSEPHSAAGAASRSPMRESLKKGSRANMLYSRAHLSPKAQARSMSFKIAAHLGSIVGNFIKHSNLQPASLSHYNASVSSIAFRLMKDLDWRAKTTTSALGLNPKFGE